MIFESLELKDPFQLKPFCDQSKDVRACWPVLAQCDRYGQFSKTVKFLLASWSSAWGKTCTQSSTCAEAKVSE